MRTMNPFNSENIFFKLFCASGTKKPHWEKNSKEYNVTMPRTSKGATEYKAHESDKNKSLASLMQQK